MRYKVKTKDGWLIVTVKLTFGETLDEYELNHFSRAFLRGFLKPKLQEGKFFEGKKKTIEYRGAVAIPLAEWLKKPISAWDFLSLMEQLVVAVQKLYGNQLPMNYLIMDMSRVYINEVTKEIQLMYIPSSELQMKISMEDFVRSIIYSAAPKTEKDRSLIEQFIRFVEGLRPFSIEMVDRYIERYAAGVARMIKRNHAGQSGYMTNKQRHSIDYYGENRGQKKIGQEPDEEEQATMLLVEDVEEATNILYEEDTDRLRESRGSVVDDEAAEYLKENSESAFVDDATGLLRESGEDEGSFYKSAEFSASWDEDATGLLCDDSTIFDDDATGLLTDKMESSLPVQPVQFPKLIRVITGEAIIINKPVFRIGKERSYVDYFVANNVAVSRNHADIIVRGRRCFVIDNNSKNRTYINGREIPVMQETEIFDGDSLRLANEEFVFYS